MEVKRKIIIMESIKADEYLSSHICSAGDMAEEEMVLMDIDAISAVEIAEQEIKEKAIEAHRKLCPYLDAGICAGQSDVVTSSKIDEKCLGKCEYMELFKLN